jgi:hypothetical protein
MGSDDDLQYGAANLRENGAEDHRQRLIEAAPEPVLPP